MIKRDFYLNQLIAKKNSSKVKIITGLRRSGKSYLLTRLYKDYLLNHGIAQNQIIIVEMDDEKNDDLLVKGNLRKYYEGEAEVLGTFNGWRVWMQHRAKMVDQN